MAVKREPSATTKSPLFSRTTGSCRTTGWGADEEADCRLLDLPPACTTPPGEPDTHTTLINGTVRAGRSLAVRQNLMKAISQSWSSLTGQPEEQLLINITEVDASTVMEAGLILPQPGEEAAWFEHNRARLSALAPDGIKGL